MLPFFLVSGCHLNRDGSLLGLGVDRVLPAEGAVLVQLQTVGGILLVLLGVVVALFALVAGPTKKAGPGD